MKKECGERVRRKRLQKKKKGMRRRNGKFIYLSILSEMLSNRSLPAWYEYMAMP